MKPRTSPLGLLVSACAVHAVLIGGANLSLPPFFDAIVTTGGWSLASLQRAWALVSLGSGVSAFVAGRWLKSNADRGLLALAGLAAVFAIGLRGAATTELVFALAQGLYGLGTGGVLVVLMSRVTRAYQGEHAGRAQAAYFGAYTVGAAVGLASASALASALGDWRAVAFAWGGLSLVSLVPALVVRLDAPTIAAMQPDAARGDSKAEGARRAAAFAIAGYAFVYASFNGGYLGITGLLPYQLREWGWSASSADSTLALSTLGFIAGSALWGALTDRSGRRIVAFTSCLIGAGAISALCIAFARGGFHPVVVAGNALLGLLCGALVVFFPVMLADRRIPADLAPEAIGWATAAAAAGGFLIPFVLAPGAESHPEWVLGAYAAAFALSGGAMTLWAREGEGEGGGSGPATPNRAPTICVRLRVASRAGRRWPR